LILTDNNVTVIEGKFDINGSIIVQDNATLQVNNALLNFTQMRNNEHNITIKSYNGNPHFLVYNSTVTSNNETPLFLYGNSNATINYSTVSCWVWASDSSVLLISNSSVTNSIISFVSNNVTIYNSTVSQLQNYDSSTAQVRDSEINTLLIGPDEAICTISDLKPGFFDWWDFGINCSANTLSSSGLPSITLISTKVSFWRFAFYGSSNVSVNNSVLRDLSAITGPSVVSVVDSVISRIDIQDAFVTLVNTTYAEIEGRAGSYRTWIEVAWYLDFHVSDSIGQGVLSANVTAYYQNTTKAESKLTNTNGSGKLTLIEKIIYEWNQCHLFEKYVVQATYMNYSEKAEVSMRGNQKLSLKLDFVIPEFPSFLILPLFMIVTLLAVIVYRRKHTITA